MKKLLKIAALPSALALSATADIKQAQQMKERRGLKSNYLAPI